MDEPELEFALPWEFRLGQLLPIPVFAYGCLIALALIVSFLGFGWAFGFPISSPAEPLTSEARNSVYVALLVGYAFAAMRVGAAGIEHDLRGAGVDQAATTGELPVEIVRRSRFVGAASVLAGIVGIGLLGKIQGYTVASPWTRIHAFSFGLWMLLLVYWVVARAACFTIQGSRFAAETSADDIEVDLLDVRPLRVYGRIGLRFALLWILGVTIATPLLVGPDFQVTTLLVVLGVVGLLATVALLIPVLGVRRRIRAEKDAELSRVTAAIEGDAAALAQSRIGRRAAEPGLADLIAYRGLIESVPEWPYDASTLSRFLLYLLIPLGSWVAAAFVERLVDTLLR